MPSRVTNASRVELKFPGSVSLIFRLILPMTFPCDQHLGVGLYVQVTTASNSCWLSANLEPIHPFLAKGVRLEFLFESSLLRGRMKGGINEGKPP